MEKSLPSVTQQNEKFKRNYKNGKGYGSVQSIRRGSIF